MALTIDSLNWTAISDKDWIVVNPIAGTNSQQINITVTPTETVGDTETAGTVTITCTDCKPELKKVIEVIRCAPTECEVESDITLYYTPTETPTVGKCGGYVTVTVPYTRTIKYKGGDSAGCPDKEIKGSVTTGYTISYKNESKEAKEHSFNFHNVKIVITQEAGPCTDPEPGPEPDPCDGIAINGGDNIDNCNPGTITFTITKK